MRSVEFVAAQTQEVHADCVHCGRLVERCLASVSMKEYLRSVPFFVRFENARYFTERLDSANFIVAPPDRYEDRLSLQERLNRFGAYDASFVRHYVRDSASNTFHFAETIEYRGVLNRAYYPLCASETPATHFECARETEYRDVVGLGQAGGKDEFAGFDLEEFCDTCSRIVECRKCCERLFVYRARVSDERLGGTHRAERVFVHRRSRRVIEVCPFGAEKPHRRIVLCADWYCTSLLIFHRRSVYSLQFKPYGGHNLL